MTDQADQCRPPVQIPYDGVNHLLMLKVSDSHISYGDCWCDTDSTCFEDQFGQFGDPTTGLSSAPLWTKEVE